MIKITIKDNIYPERLKKIKNPPNQLYLEGNIKLLNIPGISIIGSRGCTKYGEEMATKFAKELSSYGLAIISGMAKGIDSFAHIGCIEKAGNTIAVLPSGINNVYPKENRKLFEKIIENNGLIITEYKENEEASSKKFLERNRIVSGLAIGILVIEGGHRSGTSVTARLAKEQGINIFCIPSGLENKKGITPNKLIKEGAFLVTEVEDIIKKYPEMKFTKKKLEKLDKNIKKEYKDIYNCLDKENSIHINEISKKLNLGINEVSYKLMMLELEEKIISLPGNNYKKI